MVSETALEIGMLHVGSRRVSLFAIERMRALSVSIDCSPPVTALTASAAGSWNQSFSPLTLDWDCSKASSTSLSQARVQQRPSQAEQRWFLYLSRLVGKGDYGQHDRIGSTKLKHLDEPADVELVRSGQDFDANARGHTEQVKRTVGNVRLLRTGIARIARHVPN